MKIANGMFDHYLSKLTFQWYNDHDEPPDDLSGYDEIIVGLIQDAQQHNDMEPLRLAIDWILLTPGGYELEDHGNYLLSDEAVREMLRYIRKKAYPGAPPPDPEEVKDVEIYPHSRFEWWDKRQREGLFDPSRVVTNGPAQWVVDFNKAVAEGRTPRMPGMFEDPS